MKTAIHLTWIAALLMGLAAPVMAQEATPWPDMMLKMADVNKDGMVSKKEFLDMAAKMWDDKHAKMMTSDKTMKAGMMDKAQFMSLVRAMFVDPGKIGGG